MGSNRSRARWRRAADHAPQGRDRGRRQTVSARAWALLPVPDVQPPAGRPRARVPPARAAARARGGRLERRRAAAQQFRLRRVVAAARSRAHPRVGGSDRSLHDRGPALRRRSVAVLRVDPRLRTEAPRLARAPAATRAAAAHLPHPATGDGQGQDRVRGSQRVDRAPARTSVRGHARALRRRVRARLRGDPRDHERSRPAGARQTSTP